MSVSPLFAAEVVRGLFASATSPAVGLASYDRTTLVRVASWLAAIEGHVEFAPDVAEFLVSELESNTYADHCAPCAIITALCRTSPLPESMMTHASAQVRYALAKTFYRAHSPLCDDIDLAVRRRAHMGLESTRPWWHPLLPEAPQPSAATRAMDAATERYLSKDQDLSDLAKALADLPPDVAQAIAPSFLSALLDYPEALYRVAWRALVRGPTPLDRMAPTITAVLHRLAYGTQLAPIHHTLLAEALRELPGHEPTRAELLTLAASLLRPDNHDVTAAWQVPDAPRALGSEPVAADGAALTLELWKALVRALAEPAGWLRDRQALHPRVAAELGRGLAILLKVATPQLEAADSEPVLAHLASIAAVGQEAMRPTARDAIALALAGLVARLDPADPFVRQLGESPKPLLRIAYVSCVREPTLHVPRMLADPDVEVRFAARMRGLSDVPPWAGLVLDDPFEDLDPVTAAALVPHIVALADIPRVRIRDLTLVHIQRLAHVFSLLPAARRIASALALLDQEGAYGDLGPLVRVVLATDGGFEAWRLWLAARQRRGDATWEIQHYPHWAIDPARSQHPEWPIPFSPDLQMRAARCAFALWRSAETPAAYRSAWLGASMKLWHDAVDPVPLVEIYLGANVPAEIGFRIKRMHFQPHWESTRMLVAAAHRGFPGAPWYLNVGTTLAVLPEPERHELMLTYVTQPGSRLGPWAAEALVQCATSAEAAATDADSGDGIDALRQLLSNPRIGALRFATSHQSAALWKLRRARLRAGLADFAEALETMTFIAHSLGSPAHAHGTGWTAPELAAYRALWLAEANAAMAAGPGQRALFVSLGPPGLWEAIDEDVLAALASDATPAEANTIALRRAAAAGR